MPSLNTVILTESPGLKLEMIVVNDFDDDRSVPLTFRIISLFFNPALSAGEPATTAAVVLSPITKAPFVTLR